MKRTTLMLDEGLLAQAKREFGVRSNSEAVHLALQQTLEARRVQGLATFFGSGIWDGDLSVMREDRRVRGKRKGR